MVESFFLALKVVVPLIVYMGIGGIVNKTKMVSKSTVKEMNNLIFKVLISTMVFYNIYKTDFTTEFDSKLLAYAVISLLLMILVLYFSISRVIKDRTIAPVIIQGIYRSNFVLFGLQVTASICGQENLGMTTILISVIIPMFNVIAVILFEAYRCEKIKVAALLKGIARNPLIIASLLGLLSVGMGFKIHAYFEECISNIAKMATPMSLIILGATVTISGIKKYWRYTLIASLGRLIIVPGIFLPIAIALGFRNEALVALMVMYGSPTAVASFSMATSMGGNSELAGQIVAVTTIFSVMSIFLWTYVFYFYGLIS